MSAAILFKSSWAFKRAMVKTHDERADVLVKLDVLGRRLDSTAFADHKCLSVFDWLGSALPRLISWIQPIPFR